MGGALHRSAGAVLAALLLAGCPSAAEDFDCTEDSQCTLESVMGICEPNRWCSFPAPECDSGRRYGEQAGQGLAGTCVDPGGSTGTVGDPTTAGPSTTATTTPDPTTSSTTTIPDETGEVSTTTSGDSGSSSSSSGETSGSSSSTGSGDDGFFDDFDRPDSPELGNGWIERTPGVWEIQGNRVASANQDEAYQDSVFYRPFDEALLDLETSIEFTFVEPINFSTPQLHARIQEDSLAQPMSINAYLVYMSQPDELVLTRVEGDTFALSTTVTVEPAILLGEQCRLTFRVTGTDPVEVFGSVERFDDTLGQWSLAQTVSMTDTDQTRITEPGSFGASGSYNVAFEYDNFTMTPP